MSAWRRKLDETLPVGIALAAVVVIAAAALTGLWVWVRAIWGWVF